MSFKFPITDIERQMLENFARTAHGSCTDLMPQRESKQNAVGSAEKRAAKKARRDAAMDTFRAGQKHS